MQRGKKIGLALGQSYLVYAPRLGYRASVFNLVYQSAFHFHHNRECQDSSVGYRQRGLGQNMG